VHHVVSRDVQARAGGILGELHSSQVAIDTVERDRSDQEEDATEPPPVRDGRQPGRAEKPGGHAEKRHV
jgi:hypothetical protein